MNRAPDDTHFSHGSRQDSLSLRSSHVLSFSTLQNPSLSFTLTHLPNLCNSSSMFISCKYLLFLLLQLPLLLSFQYVFAAQWDGIIVTQSNYQALQAIKQGFVDPYGILRSWNDTGFGACTGRWVGIKCAHGQVIVIQLPWRGLGGQISEKIGQLSALRKLSLHDNFIGGMVPTSLGFLPNLRGVQLFNNRLAGSIPPSLGSCLFLQNLDLSNNTLTGAIPPSLANSTRLHRLNLSFNALSGPIPFSLTRSPSLEFLSLQYNNLSGSIPNTWGGTMNKNFYELRYLNLDHNLISGNIPVTLSKMDNLEVISLSHNRIDGVIPSEFGTLSRLQRLDLSSNVIAGDFPATLCSLASLTQLNLQGNRIGGQVPDAIGAMQNLSVLDLSRNQFKGPIPVSLGKISSLTTLDLSENDFSREIPVSLSDLTDLSFLNVSYNNLSGSVPIPLSQKFNSSSFVGNLQLCGFSISTPCFSPPPTESLSPLSSEESPKSGGRKLSTRDIILIAGGALLAILFFMCCILFCCLIRRRRAASKAKNGQGTTRATTATTTRGDKGTPAAAGGEMEAGGDAGGKLVHFDGPLVFTADDLLCATAEIMGKSTYGTVYKATLEDGNQVAVKRLREKIAKSHREFEVEVNLLGKIRHPNLLSLRAYYLGPKGEKLLVFDYMPRGSLGAFLHARGPDFPIDWPTRMNIIMGIARGLCYLHTNEDIVHGNLSGGNILLDEATNAKISDFGLSRLMTTTANSNVAATAASLGYRAPELSKLKKPNTKTDVYSLGVIMLELLTGKSPSEPTNGMDLPQWVASIVKEEWTNEVFDLELMRDASTTGDELLDTLKLALHCVDPAPTARPDVPQLLQQLEKIKPELASSTVDPHTGEDAGGGSSIPSAGD